MSTTSQLLFSSTPSTSFVEQKTKRPRLEFSELEHVDSYDDSFADTFLDLQSETNEVPDDTGKYFLAQPHDEVTFIELNDFSSKAVTVIIYYVIFIRC